MRVRIAYTVDVDGDTRRAINRYHGRPGLATRDDIQQWYRRVGLSMDLDLSAYYGSDDDAATREAILAERDWDQ